jgi:hypothetical protein
MSHACIRVTGFMSLIVVCVYNPSARLCACAYVCEACADHLVMHGQTQHAAMHLGAPAMTYPQRRGRCLECAKSALTQSLYTRVKDPKC